MRKQALTMLSTLIAISILLAACGNATPTAAPVAPAATDTSATQAPTEEKLSGTISVSGAFALYPMMTVWADEFSKLHPKVQFDVQGGGAGKGMTDVLAGAVEIGMISRSIKPEEEQKGAYWVPVAKDAVFPVVSKSNPVLAELTAKGIGRLLVDTNVDKPWSQYFCCMAGGHGDFIKNNPIATKRALRAIFKAIDLTSRDPAMALRELRARNIVKQKDEKYMLQTLKEIPYGRWREYNPEDTIRFYALRMRDTGLMKANPQQFIDEHADWRFIRELKKEFGITAW